MPLPRRIILYAAGLAILVAGAALWLGVLREIRAPVSSLDNSPAPSRPSNTECAALINQLKRTPADQRGAPEIRDRLRLCSQGR